MDTTKTIIITGASSGLGLACATNIAATSPEYKIILACITMEDAEKAATQIIQETGNRNIVPMQVDLSSLESIRGFVESVVSAKQTPVYGLVCNAGIGGLKEKILYTKDGFEQFFGINYLGHFWLANLLLPYMSEPGRIAVVTSDMHEGLAWPGTEELAHPTRDLGNNRYALSKLCDLFFSYELARKMEQSGRNIIVNAFNPGLMTDTNLFSDKSAFTDDFLKNISGRLGSREHSAKELAALITDPRYDGVTGKYIDRGTEMPSSELSYSVEIAKELWDTSMELCDGK